MIRIMNYQIGISTLLYFIPKVCIIFLLYLLVKILVKRNLKLKPLSVLFEFVWILTIFTILKITGIIDGDFTTTSVFEGNVNFSFDLFEEGLSRATLLNLMLFVPFGFFSVTVFKKLREKWLYGVLIGFILSVVIEILQSFIGRFVQLDDVIMNTTGTFIGCITAYFILNLNLIQRIRKLKNLNI